MQEIAKDPSNTVNQGVFIQRCNEFTTRAAAVYDGLCEYQDNMNYTVQQKVNQMNKRQNCRAEPADSQNRGRAGRKGQ